MAIKSSPRKRSASSSSATEASPLVRVAPTADPLRGVRHKETEIEFGRLKEIVPSIAKKQSVSKLDVILEAIRYIDQLQDRLVEQIHEQGVSPSLAEPAAAAVLHFAGKENTNADLLRSLSARSRHVSQ